MYQRQLPWVQTVDKDVSYPICTCGNTSTPPRCDGGQDSCQPQEHVSTRKQQLFICGCGRSEKLPFCDGSHNRNNGKSAGDLIREFVRNPFK